MGNGCQLRLQVENKRQHKKTPEESNSTGVLNAIFSIAFSAYHVKVKANFYPH